MSYCYKLFLTQVHLLELSKQRIKVGNKAETGSIQNRGMNSGIGKNRSGHSMGGRRAVEKVG